MSDPNEYYETDLAARSYDAFYTPDAMSAVAGDIPFYVDLARAAGPRVLELACGTGRLLGPLIDAGFDVTGVDASAAMLAVARDKLVSQPKLIHARMEAFEADGPFDLAIIAFRSFQHVTDPALQRKTLQRAHAHLRDGGRLVIDLFDPRFEYIAPGAASPIAAREVVDAKTGHTLRRSMVERVNDPLAQTVCDVMRVEELDASGAVIDAIETSWALKWATQTEMRYLFELTGFAVEHLYGDFQRGLPAYGKEQIWVVCKEGA